MNILMVTRENQADRLYGLGKSLAPIVQTLEAQGITCVYLSQADLTPKNRQFLVRLNATIAKIVRYLPAWCKATDLTVLCAAALERINMGRLALKTARRHAITHVHCHDPLIALGVLMGRRWEKLQFWRRYPTIICGVTQHGFGSYTQALHEDGLPLSSGMMRWLRNIERRVLLKVSFVIVPSAMCLQQLSRDLACYRDIDHWHAIGHPQSALTHYERTAARMQLTFEPDCCYLLSVGRLVPLKDFYTLIQACAQLKTVRNWHLVILGGGDTQAYLAFAAQCGLPAERLTITCTDDMGLWYAAADIYVSTSLTESFGMANHEALCVGLPTVLTAVGGVPDMAQEYACYIPPNNIAALQRQLTRWIDNPDIRRRVAQNTAEYVSQWPSCDAITAQYVDIYNTSQGV